MLFNTVKSFQLRMESKLLEILQMEEKNFFMKISVVELKASKDIYLQDYKPRFERHFLTIVGIIFVICFCALCALIAFCAVSANNWRQQLDIEQEKTKGLQQQIALEHEKSRSLKAQIEMLQEQVENRELQFQLQVKQEQEKSKGVQAQIEMLQEQMENRELQFQLQMTQEQEKSRDLQAQLEKKEKQLAIWKNKYESAEERIITCQNEQFEFQKNIDLNILFKKGACVLGTYLEKPGLKLFC